VARMGGVRNYCKILVKISEGKRPLGRHRRRWEDNIRMDLWKRVGGVEWIHLAKDKNHWRDFVNTVMKLWAL